MESFFSSPQWRFGMLALLHSLWQGALIAGGLAFCLKVVPVRRAHLRYACGLGSLLLLILSTATTFSLLKVFHEHEQTSVSQSALASLATVPAPPASQGSNGGKQLISEPASHAPFSATNALHASKGFSWVPWLSTLWMGGVLLMLGRILLQFHGIRLLTLHSMPAVERSLLDLVKRLAARLGIQKPITVMLSSEEMGPAVYGILKPTILLPASCLTGFSPKELEAILLHELAHIRKHDFLVNLLQEMLEAAYFFNPAVWWISRKTRQEREACCDLDAITVLGEASEYARVLTSWSEKALFKPEVALGFDGSGTLLDRLKRLLLPGYTPGVRLPWKSLIAGMSTSVLILASIWSGATGAAVMAAKALTAEERIQRIQELSKTNSPPNRAYKREDQITVSGTVRTESGAPLPPGTTIAAVARRPSYQGWFGISLKNGAFSNQVEFGTVYLKVGVKNATRGLFGPFEAPPGGAITNLDLVLMEGTNVSLQVVDPTDKPIANAKVAGGYDHPADGPYAFNFTTDAEGLCQIEHWLSHPMQFNVEVPGFQYAEFRNVHFEPGLGRKLILQPATPYQARVVSKADSMPVEGAEVRLIAMRGSVSYGVVGRFQEGKLLTQTDGNGVANITTLPEAAQATLVILAAGYAPQVVRNIRAGQANQVIALEPPVSVEGRITGDLSLLKGFPDNPQISATVHFQPFEDGDNIYSTSYDYPVVLTNGIGTFTFQNLFPGKVTVLAGNQKKEITLLPGNSSIALDLAAANESLASADGPATREVVFRLQPPAGDPAISGSMRVDFWQEGATQGQTETIAITNSLARLEVPVPGFISWESEGQIPGYWMEKGMHQKIGAGSGPEQIQVPAYAAGAVYGNILEADGTPASGYLVSVVVTKRPPQLPQGKLYTPEGKNSASKGEGPTRFLAQPLIFGGEYVLVAFTGNTYTLSDPVTVTAEKPIQQVTLKISPGQNHLVYLKDESGAPILDQGVKLLYIHHNGHTFSSPAKYPDAEGKVLFERINPQVPGKYFVVVESNRHFQPRRVVLDFSQKKTEVSLHRGLIWEGTLTDATTGNPLKGVKLRAFLVQGEHSSNFEAEGATTAEGKFRFSNLVPGKYDVYGSGGNVSPSEIVIQANTLPQDLTLKPY